LSKGWANKNPAAKPEIAKDKKKAATGLMTPKKGIWKDSPGEYRRRKIKIGLQNWTPKGAP
jgi:hypothetical protein